MSMECPAQYRSIGIFSRDSSEAALELVEVLYDSLAYRWERLELSNQARIDHHALALIDCRCHPANRIQTWLNLMSRRPVPPVALYNTPRGSLHESLLEWPCVRGFFYRKTQPEQIVDGLRLLLKGDFWVPRRLLHGYLERNRRTPTQHIRTPETLTPREREILESLEQGATNAAMARTMEVSEHTVKTHLYNIYRKIDVSNRIEAINWSRQNISAQQRWQDAERKSSAVDR